MKNLLKHRHMYQAIPFLNYIIENLIWFLSDFLGRCTRITWYPAFLKKMRSLTITFRDGFLF